MAADELALELELEDRGGLLHPGHEERIAEPLPLAGKALGRIVGVAAAHEPLEWLEGDPVALLEL